MTNFWSLPFDWIFSTICLVLNPWVTLSLESVWGICVYVRARCKRARRVRFIFLQSDLLAACTYTSIDFEDHITT